MVTFVGMPAAFSKREDCLDSNAGEVVKTGVWFAYRVSPATTGVPPPTILEATLVILRWSET
jgi:hypothetical protein